MQTPTRKSVVQLAYELKEQDERKSKKAKKEEEPVETVKKQSTKKRKD
jgi:hypothetical protein